MNRLNRVFGFVSVLGTFLGSAAYADDAQFERGRSAVYAMTGCYLVDYSYVETEGLRPGYVRDNRVYDVNQDKSVKEWIYSEQISPSRIRLQHILFATDLDGNLLEGSELRHQAEDWEFEAPFLYDFVGPMTWAVKDLRSKPSSWTRRITNLDDGLRYQCSAPWDLTSAFAEWSCDNYAPIPGRETRDMGRKDYNTLERSTRIHVYSGSWLERQNNVKVVHDILGTKTALAKELGKTWYVRLPDSECAPAKTFAQPRIAFWNLLRETWDEVLTGDRAFSEKSAQPSRYVRIMQLESQFLSRDMNDPAIRKAAKDEILKIIRAYRAN